jgi:uncharacterized LabA/DUF88 family protein
MAPPRSMQAKRLMIFADGGNLVSRYESLHAKGRTPRREVVYEPETYVWGPAFVARGEYIVLRATYYASVVGDEQRRRAVEEALRGLRVYLDHVPHWVHENPLYPKLFQRQKGRETAKGLDVQLTVDVLSNVYQDNCDAVLLMSGDGDYAPVLEECIRRGKIAIVAAFSEGLSQGLRQVADRLYLLDDYYFDAGAT